MNAQIWALSFVNKMLYNHFIEFYTSIEKFSDYDYLLSILKFNMAPVLDNKKIGGLIRIINGRKRLKDTWTKKKNELQKSLSLDFFEVKDNKNSILVYFYKSKKLAKRLNKNSVRSYLSEKGYRKCKISADYLKVLKKNFQKSCPVEVGIFLGYPLVDVVLFGKGCQNYKCIGYWKCFYNKEKALRTFSYYDKSKVGEMKSILRAS